MSGRLGQNDTRRQDTMQKGHIGNNKLHKTQEIVYMSRRHRKM